MSIEHPINDVVTGEAFDLPIVPNATMTNRELFATLPSGTIVVATMSHGESDDRYGKFLIDQGRQYVWTGSYLVGPSGRTHARLLEWPHSRNFRHVEVTSENPRWFSVVGNDGWTEPLTVSDGEKFFIGCLVNDLLADEQRDSRFREDTERHDQYVRNLNTAVALITSAFREHFTDAGEAEEFNDLVNQINDQLFREAGSVVELDPILTEYTVMMKVTAVYTIPITVKAKDEDDAENKAHDTHYDETDWLRVAAREDDYPDIEVDTHRIC